MSNPVLRLITKTDLTDPKAIARLRDWRIKNRDAYFGNYVINSGSIKKWLQSYILENDSRFLYWVMVDGEFIGHMGVNHLTKNSVEIDNVSRGSENHKGAMHKALQYLLEVYRDKRIWLRVKPTNAHALHFYSLNGFQINDFGKKYITMQYKYWVEDPDGGVSHR